MAARGRILLFDGVCNLCNGWVRWVLRRDRAQRFSFASLQSDAGRAVLLEAGVDPDSLPDALVLVEDGRVHTRSSAVLRAARSLGAPVSWFGLLLVVPRPLRDAVYDLIARHRFEWFGRRERCPLPTPEERARFLDADEPRPVVEPAPVRAAERSGRGEALRGFGLRLLGAYLIVYALPFPLTLAYSFQQIPGAGRVAWVFKPCDWLYEAYEGATRWLATHLGALLFGLHDLDFGPSGSGDRLTDYLDLLVVGLAALVVAVVWSLRARSPRVSARAGERMRVLARWYLGTTLLAYGWGKVFPLQFPFPGPERLIQPYGDSSPMGLAWTFVGASTGYQVFGGLLELLGGYLLLFRRTSRLGALVTAGVMSHVVALNVFYDVPVKLFSSHLLVYALFLLAPDVPRLLALLVFDLPTSPPPAVTWTASERLARAGRVLAGLLVLAVTVGNVVPSAERLRERRTGSPLRGLYVVESFERDGVHDRDNADAERWVRLGMTPPYAASIQRADGTVLRLRVDIDEDAHTVSFFDRGGEPPEEPQFAYELSPDGVLHLRGRFEDGDLAVELRRQETPTLLESRGFRWINEYPFNR